MKHLIFIILIIFLSGCKKNETNSNIDDDRYNFPSGFIIKPKTNVSINISPKTDEIIEMLAGWGHTQQYSCYDNQNPKPCGGLITETTNMFVNFTETKKEISFLTERSANCKCVSSETTGEELQTIPLNKISRVDTISIFINASGEKLTSVMIYPKYNSEAIEFKNIRRYENPKTQKHYYSKNSGTSKEPIIFRTQKYSAYRIKQLLEELIEENQ